MEATNLGLNEIVVGQLHMYKVKQIIGNGAISQVLLADIVTSGCNPSQVAIKVLKSTTFLENEVNKYFNEELLLMRGLCGLSSVSEHIVRPIEVIEYSYDCYLLVMEYCDHGSLLDQIRSIIPERLRVVVNFSAQLAQGISFLHDIGIAHRDLKPENIFVGERSGSFILKIGDFGLAKIVKDQNSMMRSCIGTINYMAPEMLRNESYNSSVDVWSLGCIMHELFTGEQLFADHTADAIASQIKAFTGYYNLIPGIFGRIIAACLHPSPVERIHVDNLYSELYELYQSLTLDTQHLHYHVQEQQQQQQQSSTSIVITRTVHKQNQDTNLSSPSSNSTIKKRKSIVKPTKKRNSKKYEEAAAIATAVILYTPPRQSHRQPAAAAAAAAVSLVSDKESQRAIITARQKAIAAVDNKQPAAAAATAIADIYSSKMGSLKLRRASSEILNHKEDALNSTQTNNKHTAFQNVSSPPNKIQVSHCCEEIEPLTWHAAQSPHPISLIAQSPMRYINTPETTMMTGDHWTFSSPPPSSKLGGCQQTPFPTVVFRLTSADNITATPREFGHSKLLFWQNLQNDDDQESQHDKQVISNVNYFADYFSTSLIMPQTSQ